ncbi:unannotated protein [freshwater metagenome]|uniref:Unannotated protein n=1 Tax=freshwater metagenome TaxID=449393 RepID=A0A6J7GU23_9ZZZZ
MFGNSDVTRDDLIDLGMSDGFRNFAKEGIGNSRWCPHRKTTEHAARLTTVVVDLGKDRHAMTMDGIGDSLVARNHIAVKTVNEFLVRPVGGVRAVLFGDDESGATRCTRGVVVGMLLGGLAITGVVGEVGAEDNAVSGRHWPELKRCP